MDVSIIIVNWNSVDFLRQCLLSIYRSTADIDFEIITIDNASFDGCKEMLNQEFPQVRFIQSEKNLGFANANNVAFKMSRGRNIMFLNPDTEVEGRTIEILSSCLDSLPDSGVVGAKLLNSDRSVQTSCIRVFPNILNQLLESNALRNAFPRAGMWGTRLLLNKDNAPAVVDVVSGASLMIKRSVFESVGMFSTEYFMYSEDIDLCFKVQEAGWKTYYVPMAVIVHHGGASSSMTGENAFSSVMMMESRWRFFRKTRSSLYSSYYRIVMFFACVMRIGMIIVVWPIFGLRGKSHAIGRVLKKWTAKLRWTLGREKWVKNY